MQRLRTIGQVFDYTFNNLESWDHNHEGRKTNVTNSNKFIDIHGRSLQISKIKQPTMDVVKTVLRERDDASNRTVNLCVGTTQVALNFCLGRGLIPWPDPRELFIKSNRYSFPMLEVKRVDKPIFSKEQVIHMYEYGLRLSKSLGALYQNVAETILLSAFTGISWSEFIQLQSCDIHLDARIPYIEVGGRRNFTLKRMVRKRKIPLANDSAMLIPILKRRMEDVEHSVDYQLFGDDWISRGKQGQDQHRRIFESITNDLNLSHDARGEKRTPYCLRHSFCTWSLRDGKCIETTSQLMGHSNLNTTRRYLHLVLDDYVESMPASNQLTEAI